MGLLLAQGWTGWGESTSFPERQQRTWLQLGLNWFLPWFKSAVTWHTWVVTPRGKKSGNTVWEENNTQKENKNRQHRGAHTLCPNVFGKTLTIPPTSELDRPAVWGLLSLQAAEAPPTGHGLSYTLRSFLLPGCREGCQGCGLYYKSSFTTILSL